MVQSEMTNYFIIFIIKKFHDTRSKGGQIEMADARRTL
jgi:hypothetical protein